MKIILEKKYILFHTIMLILLTGLILVIASSSPSSLQDPGHGYEDLYLGKLQIADNNVILLPQSTTNEGGELIIKGASNYPTNWSFDNFKGDLRFFHDGIEYLKLYSNGNLYVKGDVAKMGTYYLKSKSNACVNALDQWEWRSVTINTISLSGAQTEAVKKGYSSFAVKYKIQYSANDYGDQSAMDIYNCDSLVCSEWVCSTSFAITFCPCNYTQSGKCGSIHLYLKYPNGNTKDIFGPLDYTASTSPYTKSGTVIIPNTDTNLQSGTYSLIMGIKRRCNENHGAWAKSFDV